MKPIRYAVNRRRERERETTVGSGHCGFTVMELMSKQMEKLHIHQSDPPGQRFLRGRNKKRERERKKNNFLFVAYVCGRVLLTAQVRQESHPPAPP